MARRKRFGGLEGIYGRSGKPRLKGTFFQDLDSSDSPFLKKRRRKRRKRRVKGLPKQIFFEPPSLVKKRREEEE